MCPWNDRSAGRLGRATDTVPSGSPDTLAEVLQSVRLSGGVFLDAHFSAPWAVAARVVAEDCRPYLRGPAELIAYHYVVAGRMTVRIDGEPPLEVGAGETVLLARNDAHVLESGSGLSPVSADELIEPAQDGGLARIVHGGGGAATHVICGFLGSDERRNPLMSSLPRALKVDLAAAGSSAWIEASLRFALDALRHGEVGGASVMSKLSEVMFVEAVRAWIATVPERQRGWIAGMRDPVIGRALALLHSRFKAPWTAAALAREVALSRSAFTERFTARVGVPPMRYLTTWRLQVAQALLRDGDRPVAQIAWEVGYEAEAAFTRAFKREFGLPPRVWRRRARGADSV